MKDYEKLLKRKVTLSDYFRKNTIYFYAYPSGEDSGFFSITTPEVEELIAARTLTCAGPDVKIVVFPRTVTPPILKLMKKDLGMTIIPKKNMIILPKSIDVSVKNEERNEKIKKALKKVLKRRSFVMAQPYSDPEMDKFYQIPPERTMWVNNKDHMALYIPKQYLPGRQAAFSDGKLFGKSKQEFNFPCTVKITTSSSGEGVRICRKQKELEKVKKEWENIEQEILIEDFIDAKKNLGIQFGILPGTKKEIEIIGWSQQVVTDEGEWLGGVIDYTKDTVEIEGLSKLLKEEILPQIRDRGWYGIGGMDILIGKNGKPYFIDCNFRVTGMTTFLLDSLKNPERPTVSFLGTFAGSEEDFKSRIVPIAKERSKGQVIRIVAMMNREGKYYFNATMYFTSKEDMKLNAQLLLDVGVEAEVLNRLVTGSTKQ